VAESIHVKQLGINRCYLIAGVGNILIDAGPPRTGRAILDWIATIPVRPADIQLIVLTHGHPDHVGSAADLRKATGAKIAVHHLDQEWVEKGRLVWPTPASTWGGVARLLMYPVKPLLRFDGLPVDVVLGDEGLPLADYGISGRIIYTPGHTLGSVSVLLDSGDAFVSCMAHSGLPFRLRPGLPIFADDLPKLRESWKVLLELGAQTIYPAHGGPFSAEVIRRALSGEPDAVK